MTQMIRRDGETKRRRDGVGTGEIDVPEIHPLDEHNRKLLSHVHPPGWTNPEPASRYNLVVIGAGAGGLVSSIGTASLGGKVALVEKNLLGGDCLNVGCVPSKALLRCARAAADVRSAHEFGVRGTEDARVDFGAVMERMRRLRAGISPIDGVERLGRAGVDVFLGHGTFTGPDRLEVDGKVLRFSRAIIATGARAAGLPIAGLEEAGYLTNETVFWLTELPRRLAVIGAGPIGCELSQAFARFGSEVHLLENTRQILGREDRDAAEIIEKALVADGVHLRCGLNVMEVQKEGEEKVLVVEGGRSDEATERQSDEGSDGKMRRELRVDEILIGVGRKPNVEGLGLEAAGVAYDSKSGVQIDDRLRTSNRRIYAVGDVCFKYKFTHVSDAMARMAIRNAFFFGRSKASALTISWCTYTDPEVAHVGMYEQEAREKGINVETIHVPLSEVDRAILDGEEEGFLKVHHDGGRILGATLVARHAGEMISEITLAMVAGAGLGMLSGTIHPYPTQAEVIRKAGDAFNRGRLTPRVAWVLRKILAWQG